MNQDTVVQGVRYGALMLGGILVGRGTIKQDDLNAFITNLPSLIGALTMLGTAVWGFYVKWNTKAVPSEIGAKPSVPTLSPVTGKVEEPVKK